MTGKVDIQGGKIVFGSAGFKKAIREAEDGAYMWSLEEWKRSRSIRQNNLYWKWVTIIGNDLGYHKDELHEEFIDQFSDIYTTRDINGKPKQRRVRTSAMNVEQMTRYMDRINQFAAENGILLPQPEPEIV